MITFGPVPSRRLGRSLGINNIPPKSCSYSCVYCQVGPTHHRKINQPHPELLLDKILDGILLMADSFQGELTTETMLVEGINNDKNALTQIGDFLAQVKPARAYLSVPIRPTAQAGIHAPSEEQVNRAYQIISRKFSDLEYLIGYEGNAFASSGDISEDLLSITSVHPMREDAVRSLLDKRVQSWDVINRLIENGLLRKIEYEGHHFYIRAMKT